MLLMTLLYNMAYINKKQWLIQQQANWDDCWKTKTTDDKM